MQNLIKAVISLCLCISFAAKAQQMPTGMPNQIKETTPYAQEDELKVFAFFKFSCPVCRNYHMTLANWGKSLPKQFSFQFIPVLEGDGTGKPISDDSMRASMVFWSVERSGNSLQRASFADSAYELTQDGHQQADPKAWMNAVFTAEIPPSTFKTAFETEKQDWIGRAERQIHYKPTATPTLVICGKWMVTPDSANGDPELFIQLANGLVSKCMIEHGITH